MPPELALPFLTATMLIFAFVSAWVVFRDPPPDVPEGEPVEYEDPYERFRRP